MYRVATNMYIAATNMYIVAKNMYTVATNMYVVATKYFQRLMSTYHLNFKWHQLRPLKTNL